MGANIPGQHCGKQGSVVLSCQFLGDNAEDTIHLWGYSLPSVRVSTWVCIYCLAILCTSLNSFSPAYSSDCFIRDKLAFPSVLKARARVIILQYLGAYQVCLISTCWLVFSLDLLSPVKDRFTYFSLTRLQGLWLILFSVEPIFTTYTLFPQAEAPEQIRVSSLLSVRIVLGQRRLEAMNEQDLKSESIYLSLLLSQLRISRANCLMRLLKIISTWLPQVRFLHQGKLHQG